MELELENTIIGSASKNTQENLDLEIGQPKYIPLKES
jgi:hypothetical protein